jgi:dihydrofolate synthase/folylpolyglutamate synthase
MNYQEALDYIWGQAKGLVNLEKATAPSRAPYTLERMTLLMEALGNPQAQLQVVHVAGTKGKGSTAAMIEAVLRAAGYCTGFYSSPHLHDPRERIRLNGEMISEETFTQLANRLRPLFDRYQGTTTFVALTAMMFLWYAESGVEVAVLEVGLGGRLDATNLVIPLVSIITPLALEHTIILGDTIEEIAFEKAGIIKEGIPVITASQVPAALTVLHRIAAERNAPLTIAPDQWVATPLSVSLDGQRFDLARKESPVEGYPDLHLRLLGSHQQRNSLLAISALETIRPTLPWRTEALRRGFAEVNWYARVEVVSRTPYIIADGAHTVESANALLTTLTDVFNDDLPPTTLIFGVSADKHPLDILMAFGPLARHIIFTQSLHPRAAPARELALQCGFSEGALITDSVADAIDLALANADDGDVIVATGSLFVAAEARAHAIELGLSRVS